VNLTTPTGIVWGRGARVLWDSRAHDAVIERIVRGLYYVHFNKVLGDTAVVKVQWLRFVPTDVMETLARTPLLIVGDRQFMYRYGFAENNPLLSIWIFNFYDRHFAAGHTAPVA
jgi:hypothetical protein